MKKGKVALSKGGVLTSENCLVCGRPIAAMPMVEALCTSCRYGKFSYRDKPERVEDSVDYMGGSVGKRRGSGFNRLRRDE